MTEERRLARDGQPHTQQEFCEYYGDDGNFLWKAACPIASAPQPGVTTVNETPAQQPQEPKSLPTIGGASAVGSQRTTLMHAKCTSMGSRFHYFEVRWINGEVINLHPFSSRICSNTDIAWVISAIAHVLAWPPSSLSILVGSRKFEYIHSIALRDHTTLLELRDECLKDGTMSTAEDSKLTVYVIRHEPPEEFGRGSCVCGFPGYGCCITGRTDDLKQR